MLHLCLATTLPPFPSPQRPVWVRRENGLSGFSLKGNRRAFGPSHSTTPSECCILQTKPMGHGVLSLPQPCSWWLAPHKPSYQFWWEKVFSYFRQRTSEGNTTSFLQQAFSCPMDSFPQILAMKTIVNAPYANSRKFLLCSPPFRVHIGIRFSNQGP